MIRKLKGARAAVLTGVIAAAVAAFVATGIAGNGGAEVRVHNSDVALDTTSSTEPSAITSTTLSATTTQAPPTTTTAPLEQRVTIVEHKVQVLEATTAPPTTTTTAPPTTTTTATPKATAALVSSEVNSDHTVSLTFDIDAENFPFTCACQYIAFQVEYDNADPMFGPHQTIGIMIKNFPAGASTQTVTEPYSGTFTNPRINGSVGGEW